MEAFRLLADRAGVALDEPRTVSSGIEGDEVSRQDIARVNVWALEFFRSNFTSGAGQPAQEYFFGRGFSKSTAVTFGVGLAVENGRALQLAANRAGFAIPVLLAADLIRRGESGELYDTFRNRLMFPIHDQTGRVIGFGGRTLAEDKAKYLNTRQNALFDKGRNLYGIHLAREAMSSNGRVVVVEGYTDCIACQQAGVSETVASLGTALTEAQIDLVRRFCAEIVLLFDSDSAGETAADRAISVALPRSVKVKLARIPDGKDPSEFLQHHDKVAFSDVLKRAVDALEFKWLATRSRFSADTSDAAKREAIVDFLRVVGESASAQAMDAIQRGLLINQVAHLLQMGREEISRLMKPRPLRPSAPAAATRDAVTANTLRPRNEEQAAWTHVLEILLNEPALLHGFEQAAGFERIMNECDRRIAIALRDLSAESQEVRLTDVLARCSDTGDAERIGELVRRGAARGNFAATLRLAASRIAKHGKIESAEAVQTYRHFAPKRMVRGVVGGSSIDRTADSDGTVGAVSSEVVG